MIQGDIAELKIKQRAIEQGMEEDEKKRVRGPERYGLQTCVLNFTCNREVSPLLNPDAKPEPDDTDPTRRRKSSVRYHR